MWGYVCMVVCVVVYLKIIYAFVAGGYVPEFRLLKKPEMLDAFGEGLLASCGLPEKDLGPELRSSTRALWWFCLLVCFCFCCLFVFVGFFFF